MRPAFIIVVSAALCWPLTSRAEDPPAKPIRVPFEMLEAGKFFSGHITVQVTINSKGPYRLIFDTGAPIVLLSNKVAKECDLLKAGAKKPAGALPFNMPGQIRIESMQIGDLTADDVAGIVMDHPTVKMIADVFGPIDGIVGFPFFARYRTAIDYQAKELTFTPNGFKPADVIQTLMTTMLAPSSNRATKPTPKVLAPAAQWGLVIEKSADDEAAGVTVGEVLAESAAARAGVQKTDRLLSIDSRWTDSVTDCYQAVTTLVPGREVELVVRRNGKEMRIKVTPAAGF